MTFGTSRSVLKCQNRYNPFVTIILGEAAMLSKNHKGIKHQDMSFCKVKGMYLDHARHLFSQSVSCAAECVLLCVKEEKCLSVSYRHSLGICTLNDDIDQGNEDHIRIHDDFTYYTSRECVSRWIFSEPMKGSVKLLTEINYLQPLTFKFIFC